MVLPGVNGLTVAAALTMLALAVWIVWRLRRPPPVLGPMPDRWLDRHHDGSRDA